VLIIGNITKDIIILNNGKEISFGGSVYSTLTSSKLGCNTTVLCKGNSELTPIIKKLGEHGVNIILQNDSGLTTFINDYSSGKRQQSLLDRTDQIEYNLNKKFDVTHINPLFGEITLETMKKAKEKTNLLSFDVQGMVRKLDDSNRKGIIGKFWNERSDFLPYIDLLKIGKDEISLISKKKNYREICEEFLDFGVKIVELTFGEGGSIIYGKKYHEIPAYKTKEVDPTGAGDVYGTSFAIKYFENKNELNSALFASAAASFVVEDFGFNNIQTKEMIDERYRQLKKLMKNKDTN